MAASQLDMSLDEIIGSSKQHSSRGNRYGSKNNQSTRRYDDSDSQRRQSRPPPPKRSYDRSFEYSSDQHRSRGESRRSSIPCPKLYIENLAKSVVEEDLLEMFGRFDDLVTVQMHFDTTGRTFLGSAVITFSSIAPARAARAKFYKVPLDHQEMLISHLDFEEDTASSGRSRGDVSRPAPRDSRPPVHARLGGYANASSGGVPATKNKKSTASTDSDEEVMQLPCNAKKLKLDQEAGEVDDNDDDEANNSGWNTELFLSPIDLAIAQQH